MMKRVKYITAGLALCGILAGLTGCGMANTNGDSVSEPIVNESSEAAVSTDKDEERSRYENQNNIYGITEDEEALFLVQRKPDGAEVQRYEIEDLNEVAWVTDEWVYYVTESSEHDILWRVPIETEGDGDRLETDRAEKLFQEGFLNSSDIYVADTGVFYIADKDEVYELRHYDFSTKVSVLLKKSEGWMNILAAGEEVTNRPIMLEDSLFVQNDDKLYALDTANASVKEIYKGLNTMFLDSIVKYGDSVYFVPDPEELQVYRYDGEKAECAIEKEAMWNKIRDLDYPMGGTITIKKIFIYNERMYFYIPVQSDHEGYWYYKAQLLLSAPVDDLLNLEGDDKFFNYMDDHSTSVSYDNEREQEQLLKMGDIYFYDSPLINVGGGRDGKLILMAHCFSPMSNIGYYDYDYAIYDLDTGEIEETEVAKAVQNKDAKALEKAILSEAQFDEIKAWIEMLDD